MPQLTTSGKDRIVYCVNDWPEDGEVDFAVFAVKLGESDESAIHRAKKAYSDTDEFYIKERS